MAGTSRTHAWIATRGHVPDDGLAALGLDDDGPVGVLADAGPGLLILERVVRRLPLLEDLVRSVGKREDGAAALVRVDQVVDHRHEAAEPVGERGPRGGGTTIRRAVSRGNARLNPKDPHPSTPTHIPRPSTPKTNKQDTMIQ